ncbi:hypothetical protein ERX46_13245 [Brumimicrobium glaciale]|uniref:Uncharacterized protein n=1 Tax=Brumimicrobium glaciale TaxID=200475 RepID=A0A4Q4KJJ1_9FLAO|nr:hypothetical protein [Brumimicrobium glaciale]RYM33010.1 hypothetical protein ERX46_13245 [Brumimicrobium glaciale]
MRQRFISTFIILFVICTAGFSQIVGIDYILNQEIEKIEDFNKEKLKFYQTSLETGFNEFKIQDTATIKKLEDKTIYKVELYYSSYKESDGFSQRELNEKRLAYLRQVLPFVFENNAIEWKLMNQIENEDKSKAQNLFHGFVFYSREPVIELKDGTLITITTKDEINIIKSGLGEMIPRDSSTALSKLCMNICDSIGVDTLINYRGQTVYSGKYWPNNARRKAKGKLLNKESIWRREAEYKIIKDRAITIRIKSECYGDALKDILRDYRTYFGPASRDSKASDTVVKQTLNNNFWENALVVEDVTGSMYPYITQTLQWRRLKIASTNLDNFAFFNDGDNKPDGKIGKSGGVYEVYSDSIKEVEETAFSTMRKGNGGRGPENDIEAMIRGVDQTEMKVENIVLIADNFASVRDMAILDILIEKNIPISVIVCGSLRGRISYQYIDIARISGGKLFTIEEDIDFTIPLAEGAKIKIGMQTFLIRKGELVLIK